MAVAGWSDFRFEGIGTQWEISTADPLEAAVGSRLLEIVEEYDHNYSRFRSDSLVTRIARDPGHYSLPSGSEDLARIYASLYRMSGGRVTPLIGGSLERLGYGADYSLRAEGAPLPAPRWEDALQWEDRSVTTRQPVVLDIGAAGKGQLVDLLSAELERSGHHDFVVDGSGDMRHQGGTPITVALEHPYDASQAIGTLELAGRALCASAANRRAWGDGLHHVLDGATGAPVQTVVATWAMASTALEADALATALFLVESTLLENEFEFDWLLVYSDGRARYSDAFKGRLFA
ncbi:FAD:protein FMN transferase [Arthrobacter sp. ISL-30]|uniref:FAD:protein FMN transferase n=1 Tax=Arthrobacter sp. ISL-30 TaxID=2819109 RepID=UPI001BEC011C|nr:FAD:protein FMN transferase [Arthrobacter sp. ISL-30]MBT2513942.1 FAD:protein FMN transferase [Arthrobacter sp. ISL-30]